jgi:hypothetical protein
MNASMKATATGVITIAAVTITSFEWMGSGTLGDQLVVVDNSGRIVWQAEATSAVYDMSKALANPLVVNGLNVTTISSGTFIANYI